MIQERLYKQKQKKNMLDRYSYKHIAVCTTEGKELGDHVELDSFRAVGLSPEGVIVPFVETLTTQLATENGFICQVCPYFWGDSIDCGKTIYVITSGKDYPIEVVNSWR